MSTSRCAQHCGRSTVWNFAKFLHRIDYRLLEFRDHTEECLGASECLPCLFHDVQRYAK